MGLLIISLAVGVLFGAFLHVQRIRRERSRAVLLSEYVDLLMEEGPGAATTAFREKYGQDKELAVSLDTAMRLYLAVGIAKD